MKRFLLFFSPLALLVLGLLFNVEGQKTQPLPFFDASQCVASDQPAPTGVLALAVLSIAEPESMVAIKELGVNTVRVEFRWDAIEPEKGVFDWGGFDNVVAELRQLEVDIIATINHPPVWAHDVNNLGPELHLFLTEFHKRYSGSIFMYEIFNEPNLPGYGWPFGVGSTTYDASVYTSVLVEANRAIREQDPSVPIMIGGLSPDGNPNAFIEALYMNDIKDCFDIFSYHPYGQAERLVEVQNALESLLASYGDEGKIVWFGEFGTSDDELRLSMLDLTDQQMSEIHGMVWFSLRDLKRVRWNFGLMEYDWTRKPDYQRFQMMVEAHNDANE